jgi:hypothetical protein
MDRINSDELLTLYVFSFNVCVAVVKMTILCNVGHTSECLLYCTVQDKAFTCIITVCMLILYNTNHNNMLYKFIAMLHDALML